MSKWYNKQDEAHGHWAALRIASMFPELNLRTEEITDRLFKNKMHLVRSKKTEVPRWVALTRVPTMILVAVLILMMPLVYIFTGKWGYTSDRLGNWLRMHGF